ncbi:hypothetical protein GN958_ATG12567, partial [Phytophthora infestans]
IILIESDLCYIGSTIKKLSWRWQGHKKNFRSWVEGKHTQMSIFPYFKTHGIENSRSLSPTIRNSIGQISNDGMQFLKPDSQLDPIVNVVANVLLQITMFTFDRRSTSSGLKNRVLRL